MKKKDKFRQSFTLIELITVMVIIMIMAGLVLGTGKAMRRRAKISRAESMIAALEIAITMYHADTGAYPRDNVANNIDMVDDLTNNTLGIANWQGPYIEFKDEDLNAAQTEVIDPWSSAYRYLIMQGYAGNKWGNEESYNLWSHGPDTSDDSYDGGTPNNDFGDDIYNW